MCFSATASFASGTVLIPAGIYCLMAALRKNPRSWPLAIVPLMFGIQQMSEGFVWQALHHDAYIGLRAASLVFLFFALALWPFWFAFMAAISDPRPGARKMFIGLAIVSAVWFWILYFPLLLDPTILNVRVVHHSIYYDIERLAIYQYIPRQILRVFYFLCVAMPMALGDSSLGKIPGLVLAATAIVAAFVFEYAFVSVWCFFAAILSAYLVWYYHGLEYPVPATLPETARAGS